jgi:TonB-linked SusC/RagA family outer membrane protein
MHSRATVRGLLSLLALVALTAFGMPLDAQETGRITGTVVSAANMRPLDGAQISIEGTGMGALANAQGRYLVLNVPAGTYTVRVTMIGFATTQQQVTVTAGGTATADFRLTETALALEELVVTGTAAEVRAKEVGNSLDAVTSREIENVPVRNSEDILAGRAPGVTVQTNNGQPGAGGSVRIRGLNTVSQTNEPLIYVDGIRIQNLPVRNGWGARTSSSPLQDIAAEDIERIEVIKGAAATTLYGTEAASGVIQIFTKKGISGEAIWNAETSFGVNHQSSFLANSDGDPTDLYTKCGNLENLYSLNVQASNSDPELGSRVYIEDPTCPSDGDWQELGPIQNYSLSVRGGMGDVTYYISGNYNDVKGVLPTSRSRDGGFRGNFSFSPMEDLTFALNTSYTRRNTRWVPDGNNSNGFLLNVGRGAQNYLKGGKGEDCIDVDVVCVTNGYLFDTELYTTNNHFITGFTTQWNPMEGLSNRLAVGWDYTDINNETTRPFGSLRSPDGYFWDENTKLTKLSLDYAGSFQNSFGDRFASTFSWGGQVFRDKRRWTEIDVETFAGPGRPTLTSGAELTYRDENSLQQTSAGFFLQELFGIDDRLFITAGLRIDGNSAFGDDYGLQFYPKVSVAYILSDYDFWPTDWFDTFKFRAAMGESGKAPGAFDKLRTWTGVGIDGEPGFTPNDIGNDEVGPERTREYEIGFDASLFDGRFGAEMTYFNAHTYDALIAVPYPASEGFLASRTENVGELANSGWEFQLTGALLRTEAIDWRARVNMTFMDSEAVDLDGDPDTQTGFSVDNKAVIEEGYPVPVYWGTRMMNPGENADPVLVADTVLGNATPTRLIGVGTTFSMGNSLTLDVLAEHQGGHMLPNYTGYQNARRGSWHPCFDVQGAIIDAYNGNAGAMDGYTALERGQCGIRSSLGYNYNSDFWVEKADFWKLRSVALSWNVPARFVNWGRSATVTFAARNLFTWTDYTGTDPEVMDFADSSENVYDGAGDYGRRDYYNIPNPRTYTLSFRVSW